MTYDNPTNRFVLYRDGKVMASEVSGDPPFQGQSDRRLDFGNFDPASVCPRMPAANGSWYDARIYGRVLSADEIGAVMAS